MNDFADWLSPMVVKELRQGLRSRSFLAPFLIVQLMMIVCVLASLDAGARSAVTSFFWLFTGAMLLVALPLRGIGSVRGEMKEKTLELLLLTGLSAWRVVAGKWVALFLQTLLLVAALLPYLVLRYFLGGVDLAGDLVTLFWLLVANALLTAIWVGLSPFMYGFRGVIVACLLPPLVPIAGVGMMDLLKVTATVPGNFWLAATFLLGPFFVLSMLEVAVAKIAPAAEDRAVFQRLLAVAIVAMAALLEALFPTRGFFGGVALLMVLPTVIGAITAEAPAVPVLYGRYRPFGRWSGWRLPGPLSSALGKLLRPGPAAGLWFAVVTLIVLALASGIDLGNARVWRLIISGLGVLFLPLLLARLLFPRRDRFVTWLCFQLFFFIVAIFFSLGKTVRDHWISSLVPSVDFWLHLNFDRMHPSADDSGFYLACGVTGGSLLLLLIGSRKEWRKVAALEREAEKLEMGEGAVSG